MKVKITPGFLVVWSFFLYIDHQSIVPLVLLSASVHEFAHWVTVKWCGGDIVCFHLTATGGNMVLNASKPLSSVRELLAIAMGPMTNVIIAVITAQFGAAWHVFSGLNLALGLFNLLPIYPLDGGRILKICVMKYSSASSGYFIFDVITYSARLALLVGVVWCCRVGGINLSLVFMAAWLILGIKNRKNT